MSILLFSRQAKDPVTQAILNNPEETGITQTLDIDELAKTLFIEVCPSNGTTQISKDSRLQTILNQVDKNEILINRCYFHNDLSFIDTQMTTEYFTMFKSIIAHFITSFKWVTAKAGLYSVIGDNLPLYLQWKVVRDAQIPVETPQYHYAFASEPPSIDSFTQPVYTNPFAVDNWQVNDAPKVNWHTFVVDRPKGQAICAFVLGQTVLAFSPLAMDDPLPPELHLKLEGIARFIVEAFSASLGEVLFFVTQEQISFAAYSSLPTTASYHPDFTQKIVEGLATFTNSGSTENTPTKLLVNVA